MPEESQLPTVEEICQLPRWARVAFAARCARRAQPLFGRGWQDAPVEYLTAIENAIRVAEQAAIRAAPAVRTAREAARDAARAVAKTNAAAYTAAAARDAARAAAGSSAAGGTADGAYIAAAYASAAARSAVRAGVMPSSIHEDLHRLLDESHKSNWTDQSPVPSTVFGPIEMPPNASPPTEPTPVVGPDVPPQFRLRLRAIASRGVSADTLRKHLIAVYKALNEHFLEKYGTFLTRDQFRRLVYEETRVRV